MLKNTAFSPIPGRNNLQNLNSVQLLQYVGCFSASTNYAACQSALAIFDNVSSYVSNEIDLKNSQLKIMGAGCGTGLMGRLLHEYGYKNVVGCDLSKDMIDQAAKLKIYRDLYSDVDINKPLPNDWLKSFQCVFCIGVFTLNHVNPSALNNLVQLVKVNGVIILSTRQAYYDSTQFQQVSEELQKKGLIKLLELNKNADCTQDSKAHY